MWCHESIQKWVIYWSKWIPLLNIFLPPADHASHRPGMETIVIILARSLRKNKWGADESLTSTSSIIQATSFSVTSFLCLSMALMLCSLFKFQVREWLLQNSLQFSLCIYFFTAVSTLLPPLPCVPQPYQSWSVISQPYDALLFHFYIPGILVTCPEHLKRISFIHFTTSKSKSLAFSSTPHLYKTSSLTQSHWVGINTLFTAYLHSTCQLWPMVLMEQRTLFFFLNLKYSIHFFLFYLSLWGRKEEDQKDIIQQFS